MECVTPETTDWFIGIMMSTALFGYYVEKKTGNVVWRTNDQGGQSFSLRGLQKFIMAPFHKRSMWNSEILDQNYIISTSITTPILATASKIIRQSFS